jgi:tRNA(Ile)-lysidine synthase
MTRSHPPTLLKIAQRTLKEECGLSRGDRVLVAVSGGPDSNALLHVLAIVAQRVGVSIVAGGVDHGLRDEAGAELDLAERLAKEHHIEFLRTRVNVAAGGNLQERARAARLAALRSMAAAQAAAVIATAHHADDRAETFLLRLMRGAGPKGLAVLPPRCEDLIRPLIRARRSDVQRHISRHRLPFAVDPSNEDRRFARVRVRLEVLPLLENLSPGIVGHLNALADQLYRDEPTPRVMGPEGVPIPLGRAQIDEIRRARSRHTRARIRLSGGWEVAVEPKSGELRLVRAGTPADSE